MSEPYWLIANAVELAMFDIRLSIGQPTAYVGSIDRLRTNFDFGRCQSSILQLLAADYRHYAVSEEIIDKMISLINTNKQIFYADVDNMAVRMAKVHEQKLDEVVRHAPSSDQAAFRRYFAASKQPSEEKLRLLSEEWRVAIRGLIKDAREFEYDRRQLDNVINMGFRIVHVTDIASARAIVADSFRVTDEPQGSRESYDANSYANFYEAGYIGPDAEREGCTMHFRWFGAVMDSPPPESHKMDPNIIYRAQMRRCALAPGSEDKLNFTHLTLQSVPKEDEIQALVEVVSKQNTSIPVRKK